MIRSDQARQMLALIHQAREIGPGEEQRRHLLDGIHRLFRTALASITVVSDSAGPSLWKLETEMSAPASGSAKCIMQILRDAPFVSPGLKELCGRLRGRVPASGLRRDLVADGDWYRCDSYNLLVRPFGFDDYLYSFRALGNGRLAGIALRRAFGDRPFSAEDRNLLDLMYEQMIRLQSEQPERIPGPRLTPRARQVLDLLLRGASEKEAAYELNLSQHTVHTHVKSIHSAYGVSSRAELLVRCLAKPSA